MQQLIKEIYEHPINEENIYIMKEDCMNLIPSNKGKIILPKVYSISFCQVIFISSGIFEITSPAENIIFGCREYYKIETEPGTMGFDCHPFFVYSPNLKKWACIAQGLLTVYEDELC